MLGSVGDRNTSRLSDLSDVTPPSKTSKSGEMSVRYDRTRRSTFGGYRINAKFLKHKSVLTVRQHIVFVCLSVARRIAA